MLISTPENMFAKTFLFLITVSAKYYKGKDSKQNTDMLLRTYSKNQNEFKICNAISVVSMLYIEHIT